MQVEILLPGADSAQKYSTFLLKKLWVAARTCYSKATPLDLWEKNPSEAKMIRLVNDIIESGHWSVLRHAELSFAISGISRTCSHQLVRHHSGVSFEQQSQRYCSMDKAAMVVPQTIQRDVTALSTFNTTMEYAQEAYKQLQAMGIPDEDARFVLPNATTTNLVMTANLNALMTICNDRLCSLAQLEIRKLFAMVRNRTVKALPWMRPHLVIKCMRTGMCTESRNRDNHCGVRPHKDTVQIIPKQADDGLR